MKVLEVKNLSKTIDGTVIFKDANFEMEKGEVICIIGSSGSGKTTLLRCLNLLEVASTGTIYVDGNEYFDYKSHKFIENKLFISKFQFIPSVYSIRKYSPCPIAKKRKQ